MISHQILNEYYSVCTARLRPAFEAQLVRADIRRLLTWQVVPMTGGLIERAWLVQDRSGFNWWDCMVVAAAQSAGCAYLLTEDLQRGQDLGGLTVIDPFAVSPEEILGRQRSPKTGKATFGNSA